MKIAIPTQDQVNIFQHFGKTPGFIIATIENNSVAKKEFISNDFTGHAQGHHHEHNHNDHHDHSNAGHHSHGNILGALVDCKVIIANGMGQRLYDDFERNQKQVFVTSKTNIDEALQSFINNTLDSNSNTCCSH